MGNCGAKSKNSQIRSKQQQMVNSGSQEIRLAVLLKNTSYQSDSEEFQNVKSLKLDNSEQNQLIRQLENFGFEIIIYQDFNSQKMPEIQERIQEVIDEKMIKNLNGKIVLLTAYQGYATKKQEDMFGITTDLKSFNLQFIYKQKFQENIQFLNFFDTMDLKIPENKIENVVNFSMNNENKTLKNAVFILSKKISLLKHLNDSLKIKAACPIRELVNYIQEQEEEDIELKIQGKIQFQFDCSAKSQKQASQINTIKIQQKKIQELEDKIYKLAEVQQEYQACQDRDILQKLGVSYTYSQLHEENIFAKMYQVQESYEESDLHKSRSFIQLDQAKFKTDYNNNINKMESRHQIQSQNQYIMNGEKVSSRKQSQKQQLQQIQYDKNLNVEPYKVEKISEDEEDMSPKSKVKFKNKQGIKERAQGNFLKAIECYDEALSIDPNHKFSLNNKGVALKYLKKHEESIECYDRAIEIDSKYADAYNGKGNALSEMKQYDEAIYCFQKAIDNDPNYYYAYNNLGNAYKDLEELEKALQCYQKALKINPKYVIAYNGMGIVLKNLGKFDEAISCYDKALEINNSYQRAKNNKDILIKKLQEQKQMD